jgi:hypothetical protein
MKGKKTKNNPDNKNSNAVKGVYVTSDICELCSKKCPRGIAYLEKYAIRHEGNGVVCFKK